MAGGDEEWNSFSYNVYCEIESLKTELKRIFKNKAIPGQPTTQSGKPYKEIFYNQIYVDVDSIENVAEVQNAINAMGYQASSNAEWVESTQTQYRYIQLVLGGIGAVSLLVAAIGITNTMMTVSYTHLIEAQVVDHVEGIPARRRKSGQEGKAAGRLIPLSLIHIYTDFTNQPFQNVLRKSDMPTESMRHSRQSRLLKSAAASADALACNLSLIHI